MKTEMVIGIVDGMWQVETRGDGAAEVQRLFGTAILPTPFLASVPESVVLGRLAALNPDKIVRSSEGGAL